jgi:hypothetical protein
MPRILGAFPSALIAAAGGMSANAFDRQLRELGMGARRSEVLQLYKIAVGIIARSPEEPFRDITQVPTGEHMLPYPTWHATGVRQVVTLTYRDRTTGHIQQTFWSTVSPNGITRETALATAIDAYSEHAESYDQDLIGAVHTSNYLLTPFASA